MTGVGLPTASSVTTTDLLAALSHALDLTEGHPRGHAERSCAIGLAIADALGFPTAMRGDLVHAMLLKDAGCSSNAARVYELFGGPEHGVKRAVWERDWRRFGEQLKYALHWTERGGSPIVRVRRLASLAAAGLSASRELFQIRCTRGAEIAARLGSPPAVTEAILTMDEHWDGGGYPQGLAGDEIPPLGRLVGLAQVMEIFWSLSGPAEAMAVARARKGRWFDPEMARAAERLGDGHPVWASLESDALSRTLVSAIPADQAIACTPDRVDRIAEGFALIIDGKSPYTFQHSDRVARYAVAIGERLGASPAFLTRLRRAALLHDLGKLTVPNSVLDAPRQLSRDEWECVRQHPAQTLAILEQVPLLSTLARDAASHHEHIDGRGYHLGLTGAELSVTARILAVADVTDALAADRPYRAALPADTVVATLQRGAGAQFCPACIDVCTPDLVAVEAA